MIDDSNHLGKVEIRWNMVIQHVGYLWVNVRLHVTLGATASFSSPLHII